MRPPLLPRLIFVLVLVNFSINFERRRPSFLPPPLPPPYLLFFTVEWMRRQPQARQTKQKARIDAFYKLEKSTKPRVMDPSLDLGEEGMRRLGGNILKVSSIGKRRRYL